MEPSLNILYNGRMNRPHKYLFTVLESSEIDECRKLTLTNTGLDLTCILIPINMRPVPLNSM
jgi:hypothetical protein